MKVIFLGGVFSDGDKVELLRNTRSSSVQFAADTLQKGYISGFSQSSLVQSVSVINLPFIGAYPQRYKKLYFRSSNVWDEKPHSKVAYHNSSFLNLTFIKNVDRLVKAVFGLFKVALGSGKDHVLFCYSMHLPFLLACSFVSFFKRDMRFFVIVPDLPEYMAARRGIVKYLYGLLSKLSYLIVNRSDGAVLITSSMCSAFSRKLKSVVVEGIADQRYVMAPTCKSKEKFILYTGTLDRRYGIRNLVDSYLSSGITAYDLVVCGDGDDRKYLEAVSKENPRIKYYGQLGRDDVLQLQVRSSLLVNPRSGEGEFTRFSFPSKTIEYMCSGTPVLMYRLQGIPSEYYEVCYEIPPGDGGMTKMFVEFEGMRSELLAEKGALAKEMILKLKLPLSQVEKTLSALL